MAGTTIETAAGHDDFAEWPADGNAGTLRDHAGTLRDQAADKLRGLADTGKLQVTNSLDGLVLAARELADKLGDGAFGPVGVVAGTAADAFERWAGTVKDKSVEELIDEGRDFVRHQPAVAVGIAVAAGFVLSRVLKAGNGRHTA